MGAEVERLVEADRWSRALGGGGVVEGPLACAHREHEGHQQKARPEDRTKAASHPDRPRWASSGTDNTESSHHRTGQTSFFVTLECELLDRHDWPTRQALADRRFDFIEVFCNRQRRHSTLDYASPATDERQHTSPALAAELPCPPNRANSKSSTEQRQPEDAGARVQAADHDLERSGRRRVAWRSEITDREPQAFSRGGSARPWARTSAEFQDALLGRGSGTRGTGDRPPVGPARRMPCCGVGWPEAPAGSGGRPRRCHW